MSNDREQRIRNRAYALWEQDGGRHGRHDDHWAQATREVDAATPSDNKQATARKSPASSKPKVEKKVMAKTSNAKTAPAPAPGQAKATATKSAPKPATRAKRKSN